MSEPTLAQRLAAVAAGTTYDALPEPVRDSVRSRVLDTLGLCLAALDLPTSSAALRYVAEQGGAGQAHAVGLAAPVPAAQAAFGNGVLAHSLDFDDTHLPSILHPSSSVIPATLAAAEVSGAGGREVIAAIAVGLEACVRVGMAGYDPAAGNSTFFEYGQHATSICGALGAAVAAGRIFGLDADGITHALGIAASRAAGIIEANRTGGTVKRLHCGWAAQAGVHAAELVRHGFTGPPTVLEGRFGFYTAFLKGKFDPTAITDGLGETWVAPEIFVKPYPANHFTHAGIDAAIALRGRGLRPADVASVELGVPAATVRTIGEPIEVKRAPDTGYQGQFSGPYTVTAALFGGGSLGVGLGDFTDELVRDPDRRDLMGKVSVRADAECDAIFPHQFPAVLSVRTVTGTLLTEKVLTTRGGPRRPLTAEEITVKFTDNARRRLSVEAAARLAAAVGRLDELPAVTELFPTPAVEEDW